MNFNFSRSVYAHLATIMPDGSLSAVWMGYDGEFILVNSAAPGPQHAA
jgi:hypothetical protein